jgi:hypothetical protein
MATLYITEYTDMPIDVNARPLNIMAEPPVAEQTVAIGGASAQSSAFNHATRIIRLHTDAICSVLVGANPTATTSNKRMAANQTEYFALPYTSQSSSTNKIAVITNT